MNRFKMIAALFLLVSMTICHAEDDSAPVVKTSGIRESLQKSLSVKRHPAVHTETVNATSEEIESMRVEFLSLQKIRLEMQSQPPDSEARKKHIAALKRLYRRAEQANCQLFEFGGGCPNPAMIDTELTRFGAGIPGVWGLSLNDDQTVDPKVLVDPDTGNVFYLESDGRHVTAFSREGKMLWHRNPFEDAGLRPYRVSKPVIIEFEFARPWPRKDANGEFVATGAARAVKATFNSSQFGQIDLETGRFSYGGQD